MIATSSKCITSNLKKKLASDLLRVILQVFGHVWTLRTLALHCALLAALFAIEQSWQVIQFIDEEILGNVKGVTVSKSNCCS